MNKDEVLKQRGDVYEAALRVERARLAIDSLNARMGSAREEHAAAVSELSALRRKADATEATAIQEATKGEKVEAVLEVTR